MRAVIAILVAFAIIAILAPTPAQADLESRGQTRTSPIAAQQPPVMSAALLTVAVFCVLRCSEEAGG
jgi:hypothetical protein